MWSKHNGANQKWRIVWTGRVTRTKTRNSVGGAYKYSKIYGFYINRPFRIVSAMKGKRVVSIRKGRTVLTSRNNKNRS